MLDAARRELAEELGVHVVEVGERLLAIADPGSEFVIEFVAVRIVGDPSCLEHTALMWLPVEELLALELAPGDRRFAEPLCASTRSEAPPPAPW